MLCVCVRVRPCLQEYTLHVCIGSVQDMSVTTIELTDLMLWAQEGWWPRLTKVPRKGATGPNVFERPLFGVWCERIVSQHGVTLSPG